MNKDVKLRDGSIMPKVHLGTWKLNDASYDIVKKALSYQYRGLDTATFYQNAEALKHIFQEESFDRMNVFISTKLPAHILNYDDTIKHYDKALESFGLSYYNLYMINAPWPWQKKGIDHSKEMKEVWRAMEDLYLDERVQLIGVSNFSKKDLEKLIETARIIPHTLQINIYPGHVDQALISYAKLMGITIQAYAPFNQGKILNHPKIIELSSKYHVTPAQLVLRWALSLEIYPIFMTKNASYLLENSELDFEISENDINLMTALGE